MSLTLLIPLVFAVLGLLGAGWVAGMSTKRYAGQHWCRHCGAGLKCPDPNCRPFVKSTPRLRIRRLRVRRPV